MIALENRDDDVNVFLTLLDLLSAVWHGIQWVLNCTPPTNRPGTSVSGIPPWSNALVPLLPLSTSHYVHSSVTPLKNKASDRRSLALRKVGALTLVPFVSFLPAL